MKQVSAAAFILALFAVCSCKPAEERTLESKISQLTGRHASAEEIINQLGPPKYIYTRGEVERYLSQTPANDRYVRNRWEKLAAYPETLLYQGPPTFLNYVFLDDQRRAVAFEFTSE